MDVMMKLRRSGRAFLRFAGGRFYASLPASFVAHETTSDLRGSLRSVLIRIFDSCRAEIQAYYTPAVPLRFYGDRRRSICRNLRPPWDSELMMNKSHPTRHASMSILQDFAMILPRATPTGRSRLVYGLCSEASHSTNVRVSFCCS